jgi:hypothetical protein
MTQQSSVIPLFSLLLLMTSLGVSSFSPLQTTMAAFAQTSPSSSSSPSLAQDIIDETTTSVQDSSSDDNVLEDDNEFGDEAAAVEQDNTAEDQDAASIGLQDEDATQEQEQEQDAANTNVDFDLQVGVQQPPPPPPEPTPTPPPPEPPTEEPPEEEGVWCTVDPDDPSDPFDRLAIFCFDTQSQCEEFREAHVGIPFTECREEPPSPPPEEFCFLGTIDRGEPLPEDHVVCAPTLEECEALQGGFGGSIEVHCGNF